MKNLMGLSRPHQSPSATIQRGVFAVLAAVLPLLLAGPAFAGNLVVNANGGTVALGTDFTLTGATVANPAGTASFDCPITSITRGGTTITYNCSGGSYTFESNDSTTTVSASFTASAVTETINPGSHGHPTTYSYKFIGNLSGTETVNGVSAAIIGESTLSLHGLTTQLGSATAGSSATGINWQFSPFYIADYSFSRIFFTDDMYGTNQLTFGSTGSEVNQFYGTSGIALDSSGRIYVADLYNARIVRIDDMTGKNWTTFGTHGTGANQFSYDTAAIAIDSQNRIYVSDIGNGRIDRFDDMTGANWTTFGTPGTGVNQFEGASGIAFDSAGNIYIADTGNGRIVEMADMNGTNWTTLSPVGSVTKVAIDPQNRILYGTNNSVSSSVTRVDNMTGANPVTLSAGGIAINALQVAADGTTYVATQYGGEMIFDDITTGAGFLTNNFVSQPSGIAVVPMPNPVPAIKLSGTSLSFGQQNIGTISAAQSITLTNFGSAPLDLTIAVSKDFQVSTTCPAALPGGSYCTISVSYAPTATGAEVGAVTLTDNAFTGTQTISLSGTGTAPVVGISPAAVNFQPQVLGTTSGSQAVVLSNSGTGPLTFSGSGISTTGDFVQNNNCGSALVAGTSCQINVAYTPKIVGAETGSLFVMSNAPTQTVTLTGTGASSTPSYSVSPESLVFSPQLIKTKSAAQSVVFTNKGTATISVKSATITGDFSKTGTCGNLLANKSCTFNVYFTPTAGGTRTGTLTYTLSTGTVVTVALTGTGEATAAGWLTVSPASLDFNNGYVVGDDATADITVTNTDGIFVGISQIIKSGSVMFTQTNNCGKGLAAYATCTITVTFTPTTVGTFTGTLTVKEAAGTAHKIPLSGTAGTGGN